MDNLCKKIYDIKNSLEYLLQLNTESYPVIKKYDNEIEDLIKEIQEFETKFSDLTALNNIGENKFFCIQEKYINIEKSIFTSIFIENYLDYFTFQNIVSVKTGIIDYLINGEKSKFIKKHKETKFILDSISDGLTFFYKNNDSFFVSSLQDNSYSKIEKMVYDGIIQLIYANLRNYTLDLDEDIIIGLSGSVHESKETKDLKLAIIPSREYLKEQENEICFSDDSKLELTPININAIRKQLNLSGQGALAIAFNEKMKYETVGVVSDKVLSKLMYFQFNKKMEWDFFVPDGNKNKCILSYRSGKIMLPNFKISNEIKNEVKEHINNGLKEHINYISAIVSRLYNNKEINGAILIFADEKIIEKEQTRLFNKKRGITLSKDLSIADKNTDINANLIRITSIDGAAFINTNTKKCVACGVILDGDVSDIGSSNRGSRYNSTKNYIARFKKEYDKKVFVGVVKSEDGMLNIF